jgi:signal transduction histidine kinase
MNDLELKIKELEDLLSTSKHEVERVMEEQHEAAKLLIRRDLALSRANEQLQALDEAKSDFISVAAHQLRTPLSAIKWIMHMLEHDEFKDAEERKQFIEKASQSTDRMIGLVNDLLEVDHIQSGKDKFIFSNVNIANLLDSLYSELNELAENRNINFKVDAPKNLTIKGDSTKLRALFQNLIENSIKYTFPEGSVSVVVSDEGENIKIIVKDTGIGIPNDQKIHIFTKFFRAQNALKMETVGSGLGLFIAKQIVDRHGGKMTFESKVGEGTIFTIQLPKKTDTQ